MLVCIFHCFIANDMNTKAFLCVAPAFSSRPSPTRVSTKVTFPAILSNRFRVSLHYAEPLAPIYVLSLDFNSILYPLWGIHNYIILNPDMIGKQRLYTKWFFPFLNLVGNDGLISFLIW
jgi:hypothetical protein